jgi:hypothetical protein
LQITVKMRSGLDLATVVGSARGTWRVSATSRYRSCNTQHND